MMSPEPLPETVGQRIAQARRELAVYLRRDVTAKDLGEMAGVPPSTVTRLEADLTEPREGTLARLAKVLSSVGWDAVRLRYGIVTLPPPAPSAAALAEVEQFIREHEAARTPPSVSEKPKRRLGGKRG